MTTLKGKRQLDARLKAIGATRPIMQTFQLATVAGAKQRVHRVTGHLGRSIVPGGVSDDSATVEARTPYAAAEEFGRGPVTIRPKRKGLLAWPAAGGARLSGRPRTRGGKPSGPMIFAKVVHQKAREGHPYLIPAARDALGSLREALVKRWNSAA